jgi:uncharacterized protein YeaO (DUF488 family)
MSVIVLLSRSQIKRGTIGVDVTVKSSTGIARSFAPTWDMVTGYKKGSISETEYTAKYISILDKVTVESWRWLYKHASDGQITLLCYCRDKWFCHTHILIDYACKKYPQAFKKS